MHFILERRAAIAALLVLSLLGCAARQRPVNRTQPQQLTDQQLLDLVEERTFRFFWETTNAENGLVPDRWPTPSFSSVAAVGFGLTAYGIGVERGYVTREAAAQRTLTTLRFFLNAPSGPEPQGRTTYKGFAYHFVDMKTGHRFQTVELSTMDTAILLAGALFAQSYFDREDSVERDIRDAAETLYRRAEFDFFFERPPLVSMAWTPEGGLHDWDYRGYNEAMILYILALGSPTHPIGPDSWKAYTETYHWAPFYGQEHVNFAPLFGHQFTHIWVDFRGIQDEYMRGKGIDYFENSKRATIAQRAYAIDNPDGWRDYGPDVWGLTASDGPVDATLTIDGRQRKFQTYSARGAAANEVRDDGTLAPYGAISSMPFTPDISISAMRAMYERYGQHIFQQYGFIDAFNPTLNFPTKVQTGKIVPGFGWIDDDYLGIDQGPLIAMIENHRSELVWKTMKKNPHIIRGLKRAGFTGGWLDGK